jgi:hypothetical protein
MRLYLLAQESDTLLFCIHGYYHKQTQNQKKEENIHAPRIAWTDGFVLCSEFANAKQLCKYNFDLIPVARLHLPVVNMLFPAC